MTDRRHAFTLIELLTVVAIIGILAGITLAVIRGLQVSTDRNKARSDLAVIGNALEQFKAQYGDYPWISAGPPNTVPNLSISATNNSASGTGDNASLNGEALFRFLQGRLINGRDGGNRAIVVHTVGTVEKYGPSFLSLDGMSLSRDPLSTAGTAPIPRPNAVLGTADPDFQNSLLDPWGSRYVYVYRNLADFDTWTQPSFVLISAGPDRTIQTTVNAAGVVNVGGDDIVFPFTR